MQYPHLLKCNNPNKLNSFIKEYCYGCIVMPMCIRKIKVINAGEDNSNSDPTKYKGVVFYKPCSEVSLILDNSPLMVKFVGASVRLTSGHTLMYSYELLDKGE